jgi:hypothetical protein
MCRITNCLKLIVELRTVPNLKSVALQIVFNSKTELQNTTNSQIEFKTVFTLSVEVCIEGRIRINLKFENRMQIISIKR